MAAAGVGAAFEAVFLASEEAVAAGFVLLASFDELEEDVAFFAESAERALLTKLAPMGRFFKVLEFPDAAPSLLEAVSQVWSLTQCSRICLTSLNCGIYLHC